MRILLIEDDAGTMRSTALLLRAEGFDCTTAESGEAGLRISRQSPFDVIVLDLMLPDMDGREVLRRLRESEVETPALVLSGLAGIEEKVKSLGAGADDYLTKPFDKRELAARIRTVARRGLCRPERVVETGRLRVDLNSQTAEVDGQPLDLTAKEFGILELLSVRKGATLKKETFISHLYGGIDEHEKKIIDVYIWEIRKKLANATGGDKYIETVWGRGYTLRDPAAFTAAA